MGRMRSHRRNSYGNQLKALPIEAMYAAGVSIFSLVVYLIIIAISVYMAGETPKWLGGIAGLDFCIALGALLYNIGQLKTKTELKYRLIAFGISLFVMIIWIATFIIGMFN